MKYSLRKEETVKQFAALVFLLQASVVSAFADRLDVYVKD